MSSGKDVKIKYTKLILILLFVRLTLYAGAGLAPNNYCDADTPVGLREFVNCPCTINKAHGSMSTMLCHQG